MIGTSLTGDFGELVIERDMIDVTTNVPTQDKAWRYTDEHGHEHHWDHGYPTLRQVVDEVRYDEDGDEYEITHFECPLCSEVIRPGARPPSAFREYIPGRSHYYLNGESITEERAREIIEGSATA
jgi:hypothetical protein